jgi:hypothetical protein
MQRKSLSRAKRLFQGKNFGAVIKLLEPRIFKYRESFSFYYMLGTSCLYLGDYGGALSYLRRAHQLRDDHIGTLLGLAALYLKKKDADEALRYWLRVVELEPGNRRAKRGLELLKGGTDSAYISELLDSGKTEKLFPPVRRNIPYKILLPAAGVCLLLAGGYWAARNISWPAPGERKDVEQVELSASAAPLIDYNGSYPYTFSEREVSDIFHQAKRYFLEYRDNLAVRECNRLLNSNAVFGLKQKAEILKSYAKKPTFLDFRDPFSFDEVSAEPRLYDGCYVLWKGKVTNLKIGKDMITFDFLVGYQEEKELKGMVPVELDFAADIEDGFAMELLARLSTNSGRIALDVASLRRLIPGAGG